MSSWLGKARGGGGLLASLVVNFDKARERDRGTKPVRKKGDGQCLRAKLATRADRRLRVGGGLRALRRDSEKTAANEVKSRKQSQAVLHRAGWIYTELALHLIG